MTGIRPTDRTRSAQGIGFMDYGRHSRADMLRRFREHYRHELEKAQYALSVSGDELIVETFLGPWAMRNVQEVSDD